MTKPPKTPPSSDIAGVNRDGRVGQTTEESRPDPGAAIDHAKSQSAGRPDESAPDEG